jgi:hypothetical protein
LKNPRRRQGWAKALAFQFTKCLKVIIRQLHEEPVTASPAPAVALDAARESVAIVVALDSAMRRALEDAGIEFINGKRA